MYLLEQSVLTMLQSLITILSTHASMSWKSTRTASLKFSLDVQAMVTNVLWVEYWQMASPRVRSCQARTAAGSVKQSIESPSMVDGLATCM